MAGNTVQVTLINNQTSQTFSNTTATFVNSECIQKGIMPYNKLQMYTLDSDVGWVAFN